MTGPATGPATNGASPHARRAQVGGSLPADGPRPATRCRQNIQPARGTQPRVCALKGASPVPSPRPGRSPFDIQTFDPEYSIRMANERAGVLQGTLDLMILQTLSSLGPQHGYAIAARLEQVSGGTIQLNMGTLYPGLVRLELKRLVSARWALTETKRRARFYELTAKGRRQLEKERQSWLRMAGIMARVLE
jgi:PadR family transcriptional regulator PadR